MADKQRRTMREIWKTTTGFLELMLTRSAFEVYIRPLQPMSWQDGVLTLAAPNEYVRDWCDVRLNRLIQRQVSEEAGRPVRVVYVVEEWAPVSC